MWPSLLPYLLHGRGKGHALRRRHISTITFFRFDAASEIYDPYGGGGGGGEGGGGGHESSCVEDRQVERMRKG
ncbi:hypothetical protein E2C01_088096 [Portunus trituberculatus]|uniref:Uncharacterized protein n=1 Tax=Portunus trituberculatus TaxID=210409 RepID=A0A5B7J582_PORTR|nr:hypothetical protein [Portunus trituberculatus]